MLKRVPRAVWILAAVAVAAAAVVLVRGRAKPPRYALATVDRGDIVEVVGATGTLEAVTTVQIGSQVSGTIESLYADFNSVVKKGQVIARLDPSLFEARLGQEKANLLTAKANVDRARATVEDTRQKYERAKELAAQLLVPQTDLETAKANYDGAVAQLKASQAAQSQAEASVHQAEVDLSHTIITTPIDGVVISRNVDVGQTVAASFQAPVLFVIANDLARMRVNASVDEADVGRVREGEDVTFHVDAFPDRTFEGQVEQVRLNPTTTSNVVTYNAIVAVDNHDLALRPGMTATVSVIVRKAENVLRVPAAALRFRPEGFEARAVGEAGARIAGGPGSAGGSGRPGGRPMTGSAGAPAGGRSGGAHSEGDGRPPGIGPDSANAAPAGEAAQRRADGDGARGRPSVIFVPDQGDEPRPQPVIVGISDGQYVEVRRGLEDGETVITGTEIPGAPSLLPRPGTSPSTNPFSPQFRRRQR
jgi:HlyD family secretion protein